MTERLIFEFDPSPGRISTVRRFVDSFCSRTVGEAHGAQIALAAHELLENAMKYSVAGASRLTIDLSGSGKLDVVVESTNRAKVGDIDALTRRFEEMKSYPDPFDYYQLLMKRTATIPFGSGLGLARIRAEAAMTLTWELAGDTVHVRATTSIEEEEGK